MGLVDLKTDLKSLRYGKDRVGGGSSNQPYIKSSLPSSTSQLDKSGGVDFLLRGGTLTPSRIIEDTSRLSQMFFDLKSPNGLLFTAKQNILSRVAVATQASDGVLNEGPYLPTSTILGAASAPLGIHLNKQGLLPFSRDTYSDAVKNDQSKNDNRLVQLKDSKIKSPTKTILSQLSPINFLADTINSLTGGIIDLNQNNISPQSTEILRYKGGPGSILGISKTGIKRYSDTNSYDTPEFRKDFYILGASQISNKIPIGKNKINNLSDFRKDLIPAQSQGNNKGILSISPDYTTKSIENRVSLGNPGKRNKNVSSYTKGLGTALDKITASPLYKSPSPKTTTIGEELNDLVKFRIGVIDNNNPKEKTYIHFRAFLDSMEDNYSAEWNAQKYMGRGENFYRYNGYNRSINLSWTVAAQSKEELIPMYQKLNYLASSLTPDYSDIGYMRGNLVTLTVGGYLYEQTGIITGLNYSVPQESPWEISINDTAEASDNTVKELPHIIKVTGFNFIPIQDFVPRVQRGDINGGNFGPERYIALARGKGDSLNNYDS